MLVNIKEMTQRALKEKYAVPHFNINNLEWTRYVLESCEEMRSPVILGVSEGAAKYMGGFKTIVNLVKGLIEDLKITIPVCLHIDHGNSFETCKKAIDAGFTSVMIDASNYSLEKNINITKQVVEYAKKSNVTVESEIGHIGDADDNTSKEIAYANVDDVLKLVNETNVDLVAPALGSVHGLYKGEPKLNFEKMKEISNSVKIPLVLHGGTGLYDEQIKTSILCGVAKININTDLQIAWSNEVKKYINENPKVYDPRKIIGSGKIAIQEKIKEKIILFGSNNKY
ncbi:MAG: class II fructose-1,6-bisphosphate aldolase [Firmicutes bacterium]|nr:class II fructose-1,6-bisphosphate aldolase [Bacillota bacterium]